jgi:hypothetical protein
MGFILQATAAHLAASAAGRADMTSPKPPTLDHGATSVVTNTTCTASRHEKAASPSRMSCPAMHMTFTTAADSKLAYKLHATFNFAR